MNFCDSVLDLGGCIKAPILYGFTIFVYMYNFYCCRYNLLVPQTKHGLIQEGAKFGIYKVYNGIMLIPPFSVGNGPNIFIVDFKLCTCLNFIYHSDIYRSVSIFYSR
ncbi:hypothetical protein ACJX0J_028172, partial [Zea mays]